MKKLERTNKLKTALKYYYQGIGWLDAIRAMTLAQRFHTGFRKDGVTPVIHHQTSICGYLKTIGSSLMHPERTHVAGWLHDLTEDHKVDNNVFKNHFKSEDDTYHRDSFRLDKSNYLTTEAYYKQLSESPVQSIVKGADRIHNSQTMVGVFTKEKQANYLLEVDEFIIPMLKKASVNYPEQLDAYYNIIHVLRSQNELIREQLGVQDAK